LNTDSISLAELTAKNNTLTFNLTDGFANALQIKDDSGVVFVDINSSSDVITLHQATTVNNTLTANAIVVDTITIDGNNITSTHANGIDFGSTDITTSGTITGNFDLSSSDLSNLTTIGITELSSSASTLTFTLTDSQSGALTIKDNSDTYIDINTSSNELTLGGSSINTTVNGTLTAGSVAITGGSLSGVSITATNLTVDNISINSNQITNPSGSDIDFGSENLITTGSITANGLALGNNNITGVNDIKLKTLTSDDDTSITLNLGSDAGDDFIVKNNTTFIVEGDTSNVGIGTSTPRYALDVVSNNASYTATIENTNSTGAALHLKSAASSPNNADFIDFANSNGDIVGSIRYNSGTFHVINVSDRNTKTGIEDTQQNALDIITQLRVVDYHRKTNPAGAKITGFIAQEVQEVFSPMVTRLNNTTLAISEQMLIPILTKAIQDQQHNLDTINNTLAIDDSSITINKSIKIANKIIIDTDANIRANTITLDNDIIVKQRLDIQRMNSDNTLSKMMSVTHTKEADSDARGYLSVGDVFLGDTNSWASSGAKFSVFESIPNNNECNTDTKGKVGMIKNNGKIYICNGVLWTVINTQDI
jgi:hypothetical protein